MKSWLTLRIESDGSHELKIMGSDGVADSSGTIHQVVVSKEVPQLPKEIIDAFLDTLGKSESILRKMLLRNQVKHLNAVEEIAEKKQRMKEKAAAKQEAKPKGK